MINRVFFPDDTDPYQHPEAGAGEYPPSPESWIGEGSGMESGPGGSGAPGVHVPYE